MKSLAFRARRARGPGATPAVSSSRRGTSVLEMLVAVAVILVGLLALARALGEALALGEENRQTAIATAAAQRIVEELHGAEPERVFALFNANPDDDPDGPGTAPGAAFDVAGFEAAGAVRGEILFPVSEDDPGELREDLDGPGGLAHVDLDLDGVLDDADHSTDYCILPVRVRVSWMDGSEPHAIELATILGGR